MQLTPELLYMGIVINRITELIKRAFFPETETPGTPGRFDRFREPTIMLISFALGIVGVALIFPASNLFLSASSPFAGQFATGIFVGAISNGVDFAAGLGESVIQRVQQNPPASSSVSVKASVSAAQETQTTDIVTSAA